MPKVFLLLCAIAAAAAGQTDGASTTLTSAQHRISKAMLNRATKLLSEDERLTSGGVTISAVCPGWCQTGDKCDSSQCRFGRKRTGIGLGGANAARVVSDRAASCHGHAEVVLIVMRTRGRADMTAVGLPNASATTSLWLCADLGNSGSSQSRKPPSSAEEGARSIAWNVEHKQPREINGRVWRHGQDIGF